MKYIQEDLKQSWSRHTLGSFNFCDAYFHLVNGDFKKHRGSAKLLQYCVYPPVCGKRLEIQPSSKFLLKIRSMIDLQAFNAMRQWNFALPRNFLPTPDAAYQATTEKASETASTHIFTMVAVLLTALQTHPVLTIPVPHPVLVQETCHKLFEKNSGCRPTIGWLQTLIKRHSPLVSFRVNPFLHNTPLPQTVTIVSV